MNMKMNKLISISLLATTLGLIVSGVVLMITKSNAESWLGLHDLCSLFFCVLVIIHIKKYAKTLFVNH